MRNAIFTALSLFALTSCTNAPDASQDAFAAVSSFNAAEIAVSVYEANPAASPAVVAQMKVYENQAYTTVQPIVQQAASGTNVITAAEAAAAQSAVGVLTQYLTAQGIKV